MIRSNAQLVAVVGTLAILAILYFVYMRFIYKRDDEPKELEEALPVGNYRLKDDGSPKGSIFYDKPVTATFESTDDGKEQKVRLKRPFVSDISIRPDPDSPGKNMKTHFNTDVPFASSNEP
jgi:hypothetical protein